YRVVVQEDGQWGGSQPDGTVTGMIGVVARQEAHLAIDEITITAARKTVVDFTRPYFMESSACISRAPEEKSRAFAVLSPFTTEVWLSIALSVIGISIVLFLIGFLIGQYQEEEEDAVLSLQEVTFNMYRNLVVQGNRLPTVQWPLRCVLVAWYLYCYYVYALYSGTLTAVLAIPAFEKPIDTLSDVLEATRHGFYPVVIKESSIDYMFKVSVAVWL
ncbi:Glutamate receptor ionotropic, delta-2-like 21, partial [Homarus americanus]